MNAKHLGVKALFLLAATLTATQLRGGDWPTWRFDAQRRAASATGIAGDIGLLWVRELPAPKRAWPFQYEDYFTRSNPAGIGKVSFDVSYEPVVADGRVYVPSMVSDSVTAYSAQTGEELWRFYAGGPVRFAPAFSDGNLYVVSDDGYLYCIDAATGRQLWRFKGSYSSRNVLGNERLIDIWPARGAPVVDGGVVYFASGILAFEGIFIHAVNARTGEAVWTNSTSGSLWDLHQHGGAWSYGGPTPQGYLSVAGNRLIVPAGRTPPAVYDRATGELLYYRQATGHVGKGAGGYRVYTQGDWFFNHGMLYSLDDGAQYGPVPASVLTPDSFIGLSGGRLIAHGSELEAQEAEVEDRLGRGAIREQYTVRRLWRTEQLEGVDRLHFKAGSRLGVSGEGGRVALMTLDGNGQPQDFDWQAEVDGVVFTMLAAGGRVYVVTECGKLYCFGADAPQTPRRHPLETNGPAPSPADAGLAGLIAARADVRDGYAVVFGSGDGGLLQALAQRTELRIVAVEPDAGRVEAARRRLGDAGLYGSRVAVAHGDPMTFSLPPYLFSLAVLTGGEYNDALVERAYGTLRPYGGKLYAHEPGGGFGATLQRANTPQARLTEGRGYAIVSRDGPLPGAGQWTHQYGGPSNRTYSDDSLVRAPLGTLWFGGPSNLNALPRHHNGPIPQVVGGRLFILGVETISARCVYTGRELWTREIPGIGHPFTSLEHEEQFRAGNEVYMPNHPGANFIGSPYVSVEDGVYVIDGERILRLDPATGETRIEFRLPDIAGIENRQWGHILVWDDLLVAAIDPQIFDDHGIGKARSFNATSSSALVVLDRRTGRTLWARRAERVGYRHNAIAAGNGRLYVVDGLSEGALELLERRGLEAETDSLLLALNIRTGETIWQKEDGVFGTWLGYYEDTDMLLQGGRRGGRGALGDEPNSRLTAQRGATGEALWEFGNNYSGPLGLHPSMIISGRPGEPVIDPATGEALQRPHPIGGEPYHWTYRRYYGCGTMNASRYLIMFRSGAAGFTDLANFGGSGNLGGFRSGCTNSMVAADGVLNAPDYTRSCTCSYQLQTSLGFVHMPNSDMEMWTLNRMPRSGGPAKALGINFGAPGNRLEDGVLWLEYPKVYQRGPDAPVSFGQEPADWFRHHASWTQNHEDGHGWVASYGARGVESMSVELLPRNFDREASYDITFYFAEPDGAAPGERVFDIAVQGEVAFEGFDIVQRAGGPRRLTKAVLRNVAVGGPLDIAFTPRPGSLPPVLSGIEFVKVEP